MSKSPRITKAPTTKRFGVGAKSIGVADEEGMGDMVMNRNEKRLEQGHARFRVKNGREKRERGGARKRATKTKRESKGISPMVSRMTQAKDKNSAKGVERAMWREENWVYYEQYSRRSL